MVTGSVPTENLPEKSHEITTPERRTLVRKVVDDIPSTSTAYSPPQQITSSFECLIDQLEDKTTDPWQVRVELFDDIHSIPKYTVVVDSALEFTVFAYHWPIPDCHNIYQQRKRSVRYAEINELLSCTENSSLCEGLPEDDEVQSVATDPKGTPLQTPGTIVRHSVPKLVTVENAHFEVSVSYRSVACEVIVENSSSKQPCKPCSSANSAIKRAARKKSKASSTPAKSKAPLAACSAEKLRATVKATRLQCKQLEDNLHHLQMKIEEDGVGVSQSLEKDLLTIMGGQHLEATPHMKFFWEQQMKLLQVNISLYYNILVTVYLLYSRLVDR